MSYRTFALTIRPRGGYTDDDLQTINTWLDSKTQAHFIASEMQDDKRHLHIGFQLDKVWKMSNVRLTIKRLYEKTWEPDCLKHGLETKIWYSMDWYEEYSQKEGQSAIIKEHWPDDYEPAFPPKDDKQIARPISIWYTKWEKIYIDDGCALPATESSVLAFLKRHMFVVRDMEVIPDMRILQMKVKALVAFLTHDESPSYLDKRKTEEYWQTADQCKKCRKFLHNHLEYDSD